jgi:aryl-alcohol dehydrogenase-like predicted oxidoreductase
MADITGHPIALGTWAFGDDTYWGRQSHTDSIRTLHTALRAGIRHFDTAQAYGNGRSEQFLGQQLYRLRSEYDRSSLLLATKINTFDPKAVERRVIASLRRLQTDYLDIVYLHWPRTGTDLRPIFESLEELRRRGIIIFIGASNLTLPLLQTVSEAARIDICQFSYSLLWRIPESGIIPYCREHDIITAGYSPLAQGLLAGRRIPQDDPRNGLLFLDAENRLRTKTIRSAAASIASQSGMTPAQTALSWISRSGNIDTMVLGARTRRQLEEDLQYRLHPLDEDQYMTLTDISEPVETSEDNIFHHRW